MLFLSGIFPCPGDDHKRFTVTVAPESAVATASACSDKRSQGEELLTSGR